MSNSYRLDQIYALVVRKKSISVDELAQRFSVTPTTIRRDLVELESKGVVTRSRGMVNAIPTGASNIFATPYFIDEKKRIAAEAVKYISNGSSVVMDTGSSAGQVLETLIDGKQITNLDIVTYSLSLATRASNFFRVSIPGGSLVSNVDFIVGTDTAEFFRNINVDLAILGSTGVAGCSGLTVNYPLQLNVKQAAAACAQKRIAVMDSSKYYRRGIYVFCDFHDVDTLITVETDENRPELDRIDKLGVEIITV